jgi:hypothetical protein
LFGLKLEEIPDEDVFVWDVNWRVFSLFHHLGTQWRMGGMGGATGLDYSVIPATARMLGIKKKELRDMFPDIQVMENEALITMGENHKDANNS